MATGDALKVLISREPASDRGLARSWLLTPRRAAFEAAKIPTGRLVVCLRSPTATVQTREQWASRTRVRERRVGRLKRLIRAARGPHGRSRWPSPPSTLPDPNTPSSPGLATGRYYPRWSVRALRGGAAFAGHRSPVPDRLRLQFCWGGAGVSFFVTTDGALHGYRYTRPNGTPCRTVAWVAHGRGRRVVLLRMRFREGPTRSSWPALVASARASSGRSTRRGRPVGVHTPVYAP
jgi:hypothetical protein